ncbi:MAG: tyrosine--tRNA ligase, partial [Patescibacteria group bacterium]
MNSNINEVLTRGVNQVLPDKKGLGDLMVKRKIKLYQGFDPSAPSLHLGNFVGLMKLRQFQKAGHEVIFLVGDFTGMIGDPTDKLATRKKLTREEVLKNAKAWKKQASKLLDFDGQNPAKIMFNSKWSDKISFKDLIEITSNLTVQQLIERDMFQARLKAKEPIYLHEFLYPVAQGFDSVEMDVDLEVGGNDQLFNMMVGRNLCRAIKNKEKYVLTTKLLVDKEGKKIGKTTGNALFLDSKPQYFYGGIMSFPDEVILLSYELLTDVDLTGLEKRIKQNPMLEKKNLAFEIVKLLWGEKLAKKSALTFENNFHKREVEYTLEIKLQKTLADTIAPFTNLKSSSDAKRLIQQGGLTINGDVVTDLNYKIKKSDKIKIGK